MEQIKEPNLIIRPTLNTIMYFLNKHFFTLAAIVFLMFFTSQINLIKYFLIGIAFFLIYVIADVLITKHKYKNLQYLFYDDKIIVLNNNKSSNDAVINYNETIDILMYQNYLQKIFDIGDLIIKLDDKKFFGKSLRLISIGKYKETTQKIYNIIYNNGEE